MPGLDDVFRRYVACVTAGDVDGIVSLYAPGARIQIPANGPVHEGIDAIRAYYRENELAETLELAGPVCVAGHEGAVAMRAVIPREGRLLELDVVDVAEIDEQGRLVRLRAFFDLTRARPLDA